MFEPRVPADVVIKELREFCDRTALTLLTKHIEGGASLPDMVVSADQKRLLIEFWWYAVLVLGVTEREGPSQRLCAAASRIAMQTDGGYEERALTLGKILKQSTAVEDRGQAIFNQLLDRAFGVGSFDHSKRTHAFPGPDLGMCVRYAGHLMKMYKVKF